MILIVSYQPVLFLILALFYSQITGLETNVNFLLDLCKHPSFRAGDVHTSFIRDHGDSLFPEEILSDDRLVQATLATVSRGDSYSLQV